MEAKCCIDPCQDKSYDSICCQGESYNLCYYHKNWHLTSCHSSHEITPLYIQFRNDKANQFEAFFKDELKFLKIQSEMIIRRINNILAEINQIFSNAFSTIKSQNFFYNNLLKNIKQNRSLPISLFEADAINKPINVYDLQFLLKNNFKSQYEQINTKYQEFLFELTDQPIFTQILQHWEQPSNSVQARNSLKATNQNNRVTGNDSAGLALMNYAQPYPEYEDYNFEYNVIITGDRESEKHELLNFFRRDHEMSAYNGSDIFTITIPLDSGVKAKLNIRDNAGKEIYKESSSNSYGNANGIVFVYSAANEATFNSISIFLPEIKSYCESHCKFILIGISSEICMKFPELKKVPSFTGDNFARMNNILFAELAYQDRHNCFMAFKMLSEEMFKGEKEKNKKVPQNPDKKKRQWYKRIF